jgi:hypothetical protein
VQRRCGGEGSGREIIIGAWERMCRPRIAW